MMHVHGNQNHGKKVKTMMDTRAGTLYQMNNLMIKLACRTKRRKDMWTKWMWRAF